jgi:hypothetical protein
MMLECRSRFTLTSMKKKHKTQVKTGHSVLSYRYPKLDITLPTTEQMEACYWDDIAKQNGKLVDALAAYPGNLIKMMSVKKAQKRLSSDIAKFIEERKKANPKAWAKFEKEYALWVEKNQSNTEKRQK